MSDASLTRRDLPRDRAAPLPRWPLIGMVVLALAAIAIAGFARVTGVGVTGIPASPVVASVALAFEDRDDGSVIVRNAAGETLATLPVSTEGFIRGAMRSLVRERKRLNIGPQAPFLVERRENGRLSLSDPATGGRIELDAFGPSNSAAFARFLPAREARP
jgi:putative photosynthetic complex assembly protein